VNRPTSLLVSFAVLGFVACGAAPRTPASATPAPTAAAGPRAELPSGAVYSLEIARTPEETAQGLMYRESLPDRHGMIFTFTDGGVHQFWIKNTMIPLDIIWMDTGGKILFVSADTPPCRSDPCPTYGPSAPAPLVLEIAGGLAKKEGVQVGSAIRLIDVR